MTKGGFRPLCHFKVDSVELAVSLFELPRLPLQGAVPLAGKIVETEAIASPDALLLAALLANDADFLGGLVLRLAHDVLP